MRIEFKPVLDKIPDATHNGTDNVGSHIKEAEHSEWYQALKKFNDQSVSPGDDDQEDQFLSTVEIDVYESVRNEETEYEICKEV